MDNVTFTVWNAMGDHPMVTPIENQEFEYQEAAAVGAGVLHRWTIVYPGAVVVDINGVTIGVISPDMYAQIQANKPDIPVVEY